MNNTNKKVTSIINRLITPVPVKRESHTLSQQENKTANQDTTVFLSNNKKWEEEIYSKLE